MSNPYNVFILKQFREFEGWVWAAQSWAWQRPKLQWCQNVVSRILALQGYYWRSPWGKGPFASFPWGNHSQPQWVSSDEEVWNRSPQLHIHLNAGTHLGVQSWEDPCRAAQLQRGLGCSSRSCHHHPAPPQEPTLPFPLRSSSPQLWWITEHACPNSEELLLHCLALYALDRQIHSRLYTY